MEHIKIIGPLLILALQTTIKFVVGKRVEQKNYLELFVEMPMSIVFMSISFSLVYLLNHETTKINAVILFVSCIIAALIVVSIYRHCKDLVDINETKKKIKFFIFLMLMNYLISISCTYFASIQLIEESKQVKVENPSQIKSKKNAIRTN